MNKKRAIFIAIIVFLLLALGIFYYTGAHKKTDIVILITPAKANVTQGSNLTFTIISTGGGLKYFSRGPGCCKDNNAYLTLKYLGPSKNAQCYRSGVPGNFNTTTCFNLKSKVPFNISYNYPDTTTEWNVTYPHTQPLENFSLGLAPVGYYKLCYPNLILCTYNVYGIPCMFKGESRVEYSTELIKVNGIDMKLNETLNSIDNGTISSRLNIINNTPKNLNLDSLNYTFFAKVSEDNNGTYTNYKLEKRTLHLNFPTNETINFNKLFISQGSNGKVIVFSFSINIFNQTLWGLIS
ncbi:hypothetical protein [Cuniculiplasma divulgatum]|jgi:hypothetical protein|uniref:Uncharacterized protein n=1 Tax=Cuniculiplasma divulgatum TaxID=1673428 RepID=A0A1N5T417_9ARCH|nr:hypothetical protein [Cuniculiplasma divulgatum]EQB69054.1 MAG: hypothetical protein AMDU5_GPLC00004G0024 [Thermoplasmatales archaeon Gpl]MCI2412452.1 hypothetical protein [Cuniculiplasma sp.]OWP54828.1 MAG: hypothetical protein B2I18_06315 [Cuniculiplasma sp. C_DKE]WMT48646.1 MAG: hypothetical protein RE472_06100 [Thermoplasmatales archaeon]SIM42837.1 hypothetical protein CSP5_0448 [Cuniculiplasma divulgatum]